MDSSPLNSIGMQEPSQLRWVHGDCLPTFATLGPPISSTKLMSGARIGEIIEEQVDQDVAELALRLNDESGT